MFDRLWFEEHQVDLLKALNAPGIGCLVRRGLWIPDRKHPVVKIYPEACHVMLPNETYQATIYSNKQYQEAMHRSFGPLWQALHAWDMKIANRLAPALNLGFDTYTSQPDGTAGLDTYMNNAATTTNYGTNAALNIGEAPGAAAIYRSLLKFDYSSIPSNASGLTANHSLWHIGAYSSATRIIRIYRQLRAWVEAEATWNVYATATNWGTAGGFNASDCEQTDVGSLSQNVSESAGEKVWVLTIASIQPMWNGTFTNMGFLMKADSESGDQHDYRSSDYATAGNRPKQVITYDVAGASSIAVSPVYVL